MPSEYGKALVLADRIQALTFERPLLRDSQELARALLQSEEMLKEAESNAKDLNECHCDKAYKTRGKHEPNAICGYFDEWLARRKEMVGEING